MASLRQIHSADVVVAATAGCLGEGDALLTNRPGLALSVRTADCLPILLADVRQKIIAAVHAGWRGTAAGVAVNVLRKMQTEFGTNAADINVAIGPGIGPCCYEVGPEVAAEFGLTGRVHLDLAAENRRRLIAAGLPESQIETLDYCTRCRADLFHSWRRDGPAAGRMLSHIEIAGGAAC